MSNFVQETKAYINKPYFKEYYNHLIKFIKKNKIKRILDIGCASGYFFKFLPNNLNLYGLGIDINSKLILRANKVNKKKNFYFKKINLFSKNTKLTNYLIKKYKLKNYDLITMLGTISTIPNYKKVIKLLIRLNPKKIVIHTPLNPENFDVRISHRESSSIGFQTAYNIISVKNITNLFKKNNYNVSITPYVMKKNLFRNKKDPKRNYHLHLKNGKKILVNGISCLLNEYIIIASKKL